MIQNRQSTSDSRSWQWLYIYEYIDYLRQGGYVFAGFCLSVCVQDNSKSYGRIFLTFWRYVGHA